jgi:hypothetical protein
LHATILFGLAVAFSSAFWAASLPIAHAAPVTPAEMIQSQLPRSTTIGTASNRDVVSAVGQAVAKHQNDAPDIVRTAAGARKDLSADILRAAIHSIHDEKGKDCDLARAILEQAIAADGEHAAALTELWTSLTPLCVESPEEGPGSSAGNINGPPGSIGGGGPVPDTCTVCHNNQTIQVPCPGLKNYLHGHPGDTAGGCEATPDTNR